MDCKFVMNTDVGVCKAPMSREYYGTPVFAEETMNFEIQPIGQARSPYREKKDTPRQERLSDTIPDIFINAKYLTGLDDIEERSHRIVLSWFDQADRTLLRATPPHEKVEHGVFATRSPIDPHPVAFPVADLIHRDGNILRVRGWMHLTSRRLWISRLLYRTSTA